LKTAFDSVDRKVLVEAMKKRDIRKGLIKRVEEVVKEAKESEHRE